MIIITGASRGIGEFLLDSFLYENQQVIGTYNRTNPEKNMENYVKLDVSDYNQVEQFIDSNNIYLNNVILINCAGMSYNSFTHKSDPLHWKAVIDTNLLGTYNMVRALLPVMRSQHYGRIINFSSVVAIKPTLGVSAYSASKSALWGFSRTVAIENASFNITINNINMGYSELGMIKEVPEEFLKNITTQMPTGKLCSGSDILNTVHYLMSTTYINGSSINLSGGLV